METSAPTKTRECANGGTNWKWKTPAAKALKSRANKT